MDEGKFTVQILRFNKSAQCLIRDSSVWKSRFIQWRDQRIETISVIDDLQVKVEKIHYASNAVKGAGAAVSIAGGLASLAGIALALTGHQTASQLIKKGSVAQVLGNITTTSASLAEFGLTKKVETDIKSVLSKDMELTKTIHECIQRSRTIDSLTREIFGYGIESKLLMDVVKLCSEAIKLASATSSTWEEIEATAQKQLMCTNASELPDRACEVALNIARRICKNPCLAEPVRNICNILIHNDTLREISFLGLKLHLLMQSMFKPDIILNILRTFGLSIELFNCAASRATCDIVGIALSTVSVIFTAKNIQKGSEYSQKLKDLGYALKKELDDFDAEFKQIFD